eukprot:Hpha_TRINITY_DN3730_c0_g1::TRINITY_DN3730_c0_g1_i1::g.23732::m.23732
MPAPCLLEEVLSVCIHAVLRAGDVIRAVQQGREGGAALDAQLKDESDPRTYLTVADQRSQKVITEVLRSAFPGVCLVGEEDESAVDSDVAEWAAAQGPALFDGASADRTSCRGLMAEAAHDYSWVLLDDICVFIDPIDGTREFVQGRVHACQTLVGIAVRGKATAGVMYLPFHDGAVGVVPEKASTAAGHCIYGVRNVGVVGVTAGPPNKSLVLGSSASCSDPVLSKVRDTIAAAELLPAGGCANKVLQLLTGRAEVVLMNLASSLWDTCATEAVLAAVGGTLTTLHGNAIEHTPSTVTANRFGVLCTSARFADTVDRTGTKRTHEELCRQLRAVPEVFRLFKCLGAVTDEQPAADLIRDITGHYYTADDFSRMFCKGEAGFVKGYTAHEATSHRYKQSFGCRFLLQSDPEKSAAAGHTVPESVFFKRVVLRDIPYACQKARLMPYKIARDIRSCRVEAQFLASRCPQDFAASSGVAVVKSFSVQQQEFDTNIIDSRFGLILKDFTEADGWYQYAHLDNTQLTAVLRAIAYFHAFFWLGERDGAPPAGDAAAAKAALLPSLWEAGSYWSLAMQPGDQLETLQKKWDAFRERFAKELGAEEQADATLGERLAAVAAGINTANHGTDTEGKPCSAEQSPDLQRYGTIIHGDTKAANFFFKAEEGALPVVGVIDFQWTGRGLGVTDVAYCIAASVHPDSIAPGDTTDLALVKAYHGFLMEAFVHYNVAGDRAAAEKLYPWEVLQRHYERAVLDLARTIISEHWISVSPAILDSRHMKMVFNAYMKSTKVAVWYAGRIREYLNRYNV